jgi:hypothetical protein
VNVTVIPAGHVLPGVKVFKPLAEQYGGAKGAAPASAARVGPMVVTSSREIEREAVRQGIHTTTGRRMDEVKVSVSARLRATQRNGKEPR